MSTTTPETGVRTPGTAGRPRTGPRILRTELKRSVAPWAGGLALATALGFLCLFTGPWTKGTVVWTDQWTPLALWTRYVLTFMWPLAVGAGALQGLRDHRSGMTELLRTTPLPVRHRAARTAAASALTLACAYVLVLAYGGVQVYANGGYAHLGWIPVSLIGVLALVAGALLGMGAGRTLPYVLTPPVLAVAALVTTAFLQTSLSAGAVTAGAVPTRAALLSPALSQVEDALLTVSGRVDAGQAVWLLGMAATGFALLASSGLRTRLAALLPLALGLAAAVAVLPSTTAGIYVVDKAAAAPVCEGPVCVTRLHRHRLPALAGPGRDALRTLKRLPVPHGSASAGSAGPGSTGSGSTGSGSARPGSAGPGTAASRAVPVAVRERQKSADGQGGRPERSARAVLVDFDDRSVTDAHGSALARNLVAEGALPSCFELHEGSRGRVREYAAQTVVAGWLLGDRGRLHSLSGESWLNGPAGPSARDAWRELRSLPRAGQRSRVAAARAAALSCEGDPLKALRGAGGDSSG